MLSYMHERKSGNLFYIDGVLCRWQAQKLFSLNLFWSISIKKHKYFDLNIFDFNTLIILNVLF